MAHAEVCPICSGKGTIPEDYGMPFSSDTSEEKTCHGCGGKGWVEVSDQQRFYYPIGTGTTTTYDNNTWRITY